MLQSSAGLYLAVLAQVLLTVAIYFLLGAAKARAIRSGEVDWTRAALHADAWPVGVQRINNNIRNQFELPVLFYAVCFVLLILDAAGYLVQALAWLFVASRAVHAWIHTQTDNLRARRNAFGVGALVLLGLWVLALVRVL